MSSSPDLEKARAYEQRSHWVGWTVALLAVPVVYVLSVSPVVLVVSFDRKNDSYKGNDPAWLRRYAAPADWLYKNVSALQKPLSAYYDWCFKVYTGRSRR